MKTYLPSPHNPPPECAPRYPDKEVEEHFDAKSDAFQGRERSAISPGSPQPLAGHKSRFLLHRRWNTRSIVHQEKTPQYFRAAPFAGTVPALPLSGDRD